MGVLSVVLSELFNIYGLTNHARPHVLIKSTFPQALHPNAQVVIRIVQNVAEGKLLNAQNAQE